ncbi:MAG: hypothetical protein U9Q79_08355, partial [Candidatus Hydrogenedentes bacterium]|nr:hypothetical protein [Candidatus Hydrogenedentota bacterium]
QRAIAGTSLQVVRRSLQNAYKTTSTDYDEDFIKGALAGPSALRDSVGINSESRAIQRIASEMLLLYHARSYSTGSYHAYRMGVVASLVSDHFLPYMWNTSVEKRKLAAEINEDIDEHLESFTYVPLREEPIIVHKLREYLEKNRSYLDDARLIVQADYVHGESYDGYLENGGAQNAFRRAVQAVSDIAYTVLQKEEELDYVKPSDENLTWYFVDNIEYLLKEKKNPKAADQIYNFFVRVNPDIYLAYEQIGDMYFEFGDKERAVKEWKTALQTSGPDRQRTVRKLANYYIEQGKKLVSEASNPDAPSDILQQALVYFNRAMEIDRGNEVAVRSIHETRIEQKRRDEREQTDREIVSAGETALAEADTLMAQQRFGEALNVYQKAVTLFDNVSNEFKAEREQAGKGKKDAQGKMRKAINEIIQQAQSFIEEGQRMIEEASSEQAFENAKKRFQSAQALLKYIPDNQSTALVAARDEEIDRARTNLEQVDIEKKRWIEDQKMRKELEEKRRQAEAARAAAAAASRTEGGGETSAPATP